MQRKINSVSLVRFFIHTKNEACCTRRFSCRLGLFISWRTNLYLISGKDKKKKQMWKSNLRIYLQSVWNMIAALTSLCDTFMTNSFPKIQRNTTSKRGNRLAKRRFSSSRLPACVKPSETWTQLSTSTMLTDWVVPVKSLLALQVFCFCLVHLGHFRTWKTKTSGKNAF